jgi:adenosylhomocysteine nucleosidase
MEKLSATHLHTLLNDNPLYVFALEDEATHEFSDMNPLFIGVGKVNATYHLTKQISAQKPGIIINLGSAGSNIHARGTIVCCTRFIQRDMDVTALGFEKYQTPFSAQTTILDYGISITDLPLGLCGSGDCFVTSQTANDFDVIDMEAFPIAWVAMKEQIPFLCLKYITDGADGEAALDWQTSVKFAAAELRATINALIRYPPEPGENVANTVL